MNMNRLLGLWNAPKQKRYKSFCVQAADAQEVWLMQDKPNVPAMEQDELSVWPDKAFVTLYRADAVPVMLEVHDFMEACSARIENRDFIVHVFPNAEDSCDVPASQLLEAVQDELDLVE